MIDLIGLFFLGLWAAGKARQKGKNPYVWSLVLIAFYVTTYPVAFLLLNLALSMKYSQFDTLTQSPLIWMFIRIALIPLSFVLSKLIMDRIFNRIKDPLKEGVKENNE